MNRFIGLDGHSASCTFVVLDEKGRVKRKAVIETNGQALIEFVKQTPGRLHLCVEEGTQSQWFYELLRSHVHDMAIVQGRKTRGNKDDYRDALALAERIRTGDLGPRIQKVPESLTTLKDAVRAYGAINRDLTRVKNRFKHLYRSRGITYSDSGCPFCTEPGRNASACKKPGFHVTLELWRMQQQCLEAFKEEAQKYMLGEANRHGIIRILKTAPGLGPIRSAQLLSIVITPYRFRTSRQFWAYCGLGIVQRSSSDWVGLPNGKLAKATIYQTRGLNQNFNRTAKAIFKGATTTVINSRNNPLQADYERLLAKGTRQNLARLTIARKISAIVLSMWKHQEVYNPEKYRAVTN